MFGILARLLEILYSIWPSYGGSIILFTIVIMLVLAPLTFKSTRSMLAMQALQPEMKKLQNRYKDDRQKLNEEMMAFYKENKISPLGGCLPMLLQLPVFFILYEVLLGLTRRGPFGADLGHSMACAMNGVNHCTNIGTYAHAGFFHPSYLKSTSQLYESLSSTRVMGSFGLDLSQSAMSAFGQGLAHAFPYIIMVLVVIGLTYLQQQQIQSRQPKKSDQNPTQQMMMKVMPVVMGFIYIVIPAGVVVYFLVSSLFRIGQQAMVTRTFYSGPNAIAIPATATEEGEEPAKRKGFWEQFKPSPDALPQVGKRAKERRAIEASASETKSGPKGTRPKNRNGTRGDAPSNKASGPNKASGKAASKNGQRTASTKSGGGKKGGQKSSGGSARNGASKSAADNRSKAGTKSKTKAGARSGSGNGTGARRASSDSGSGAKSPARSGAKRASGGGNGGEKAGQKRPTASKKRRSESGSANGADRAGAPSRKAPSRKAPSRKAPDSPSNRERRD